MTDAELDKYRGIVDEAVREVCGEPVMMMMKDQAEEIQSKLKDNFKEGWKDALVECANTKNDVMRAWYILSGCAGQSEVEDYLATSADILWVAKLLSKSFDGVTVDDEYYPLFHVAVPAVLSWSRENDLLQPAIVAKQMEGLCLDLNKKIKSSLGSDPKKRYLFFLDELTEATRNINDAARKG